MIRSRVAGKIGLCYTSGAEAEDRMPAGPGFMPLFSFPKGSSPPQ